MFNSGPKVMNRRNLFQCCGIASVAGLLGWPLEQAEAFDSLSQQQRDAMSPTQILEKFQSGSQRFRNGERKERNFLREQYASAAGQHPAAIILSCVDSRAPVEIIFDLGIGDTFNARVAGNIANPDILGSMEFACAAAGAKVVLVLGHTACGAVQGAINEVELGNLTGLLQRIRPAVDATEYAGERKGANIEFVDAVARKNVELTIAQIRKDSSVLKELEVAGQNQNCRSDV